MADLANDPIINVVHNGIKKPIRLLLEADCLPAALALTFSGIDIMAFLAMPAGQEEVTRADFADWCDRYIQFSGKEQVSGLEFYGARCGLLHTHSPLSLLSKQGKVRVIIYADRLEPPIKFDPAISPSVVMVSIAALVDAFFAGVDRFLIDIFKDPERGKRVDNRFQRLFHTYPFK